MRRFRSRILTELGGGSPLQCSIIGGTIHGTQDFGTLRTVGDHLGTMFVIRVVVADRIFKLFVTRVWEIEEYTDTALSHQRRFDRHAHSILIRSTCSGYLNLFAIDFECTVYDSFPQIDLLMRIGQIAFNYGRTVRMGQQQTDTSQIKAVGVSNQPGGNFRFVGVTDFIREHFTIGIHWDACIIFDLDPFGQREAMPAPIGHGTKRDESLQSGDVHTVGEIAITHLSWAFMVDRIGNDTMAFHHSATIDFPGFGFVAPGNGQCDNGHAHKLFPARN